MEEEKKEETSVVVPKDRRGQPGRPKKSELEAVRNRTKGKVGRPKGDASRIQEFKERLLATGGTKIIDKMVQIALTDGHPAQAAALKMCADRVLPVSLFEDSKTGGAPSITISITGLNEPKIETVEDITDVEPK